MSESEDIEEKAAEWLVRRDAHPEAEQREFTAWLSADPRHRASYLRLAAAWSRTEHMRRIRPEGVNIDLNLLQPKSAGLWNVSSRKTWSLAAAVVAALAAIALVQSGLGFQVYRTDVGGLARVVLTDGSTMTLNTDTEVKVRMRHARREVRLTRGEAQFIVAHDVSRPFEVSVGGRIVRAVGTAFDVRLGTDDGVQVIVMEGRVALEPSSSTWIADPGHAMAIISAGEGVVAHRNQADLQHVNGAAASRKLAWRSGELSFQGETLGDAVAEFNRYNRQKLRVQDPAVASLQVGGNFQALDVKSFVGAVERSFNLVESRADDGALILKRATEP